MKKCPFCAEEIQEAAIKCRFCNSMLTAQPPAPLPIPGAGSVVAHEQRVLFDGPPSWRAWFWRTVAAASLVVVGLALTVLLLVLYWDQERLYALFGAVVAVVGVVWSVWLYVDRRSTRLRITTQTIDLETGIFGRQIDTLQLWRVRDIDFEQTFTERLLGISRIRILSHDQTQPHLVLRGLPGGRQLFDDLRDAVAIARQARNVVGVVD